MIAYKRPTSKEEKTREKSEEEEKQQAQEEEARSRQVFDPERKLYDERKRRATDIKECSRVTLPKPLGIVREAQIETRREIHKKIFAQYKREKCNKDGEQEKNLTEEEQKGLKSLLKN